MAESRPTSLLYVQGAMELHQLPEDSKGEPSAFREEGEAPIALKALLAAHPLHGEYTTALPAQSVMMMVLNLPATESEDIEGMVQLQAEEISPFPPERTCVSWEILDQDPPQSKILMALCSRKELDALQTLYAGKGAFPSRVDVDVLGWLELLKSDDQLSQDADTLLLILHGDRSHLVAWHQGSPCLVRSWMDARNFSSETLREELLMVLLALESAFGQTELQTLHVWHDGDRPNWAKSTPEGWNIQLHPLDQLPPLGIGLLNREARGQGLDLVPTAWKVEKKRQQDRKKLIKTLAVAGGIWFLLMASFFTWAQFRQSGLRRLEKENTANLKATEDIQALSARVRSLTQFSDRSSSALETLLLLASATPGTGNLVVNNYRYDKQEGITFSGTTSGDVQPFYQFLESIAAGDGDFLRVKSYDLKESRQGFSYQVETAWTWIPEEEGEENP